MDKLLKALESEGSSEKDIRKILKNFVEKVQSLNLIFLLFRVTVFSQNQLNFGMEGSLEVKEVNKLLTGVFVTLGMP